MSLELYKKKCMSKNTVTTIDLLRHGECEGGLIFRGHTDSALNKKGWQQMQQAIAKHPQQRNHHPHPPKDRWQTIISSPLQRCKAFAETLSDSVVIEPQLQEISFGDWDGYLTENIHQQSPQAVEKFWLEPAVNTPPNGETLHAFQQRIIKSWEGITQQQHGQHSLLVSHGGVIRIILAHILQMPLRPLSYLSVPHGCLTQIKIFHQAGSPDWPQLIFHQPLTTKSGVFHE